MRPAELLALVLLTAPLAQAEGPPSTGAATLAHADGPSRQASSSGTPHEAPTFVPGVVSLTRPMLATSERRLRVLSSDVVSAAAERSRTASEASGSRVILALAPGDPRSRGPSSKIVSPPTTDTIPMATGVRASEEWAAAAGGASVVLSPGGGLLTPVSFGARVLAQNGATASPALLAPVPTRSARLLGEGTAALAGGVVLPFVLYGGFTSLSSFVGFFAGFLSASAVGLVLAPIAVMVTGALLGARGGVGRGVLGALLGLVAAVLIGLPLATLPGAGYLVGLGLFWVLPSVGTLIAFEWGREDTPPPTGLTLLAF